MSITAYFGLLTRKVQHYAAGTANGRLLALSFFGLMAATLLFSTTAPDFFPGVDPLPPQKNNAAPEKKIALIITRAEEALYDVDPLTLEVMEKNLLALAQSTNTASTRSLASFLDGNRAAAIADLAKLAADTESLGDKSAARDLWHQLGALSFLVDPDQARSAYENVLNLLPTDLAALHQLGLLQLQAGDSDAAQISFQTMLTGDKIKGTRFEAAAQASLGVLAVGRQDLKTAEFHVLQALQLNEKLQRPKAIALQQANLGLITMNLDKDKAATSNLTLAHARFMELGETRNAARVLTGLGMLNQKLGDLEAAERELGRSLELYTSLDDKSGMALQYDGLGRIAKARGNREAAEDYFKKGLTLNLELERPLAVAGLYANLGGIELENQNRTAACDYWRQAVQLLDEGQATRQTETVRGWLAAANCQEAG